MFSKSFITTNWKQIDNKLKTLLKLKTTELWQKVSETMREFASREFGVKVGLNNKKKPNPLA